MRRVVFGAGYVGARAAALASSRGDDVIATVRSAARASGLEGKGFAVTTAPVLEVAAGLSMAGLHAIICFPPDGETDAQLAPLLRGAAAISYVSSTGVYGELSGVLDDTTALPATATPSQARILAAGLSMAGLHAIICFPPDGETDAQLAPLLRGAAAISYVSSTGVYGELSGVVDDTTALPATATPSQMRILSAEAAYRAVGGTVLRAPGIYGPDRGLHVRVASGAHRLPGDAAGMMSRIHADDLAALLLASAQVRGETFVVGDLEPAPQREVVAWICAEYGCPMPASVPPGEVHESLRRDRTVDGSRALARLGVTLQVPSYKVGMKPSR